MLMRSPQRFYSNVRSEWRRSTRRALAAVSLAALAACAGEPHGKPVRVTIPPGASFRAAADSLHRAGLVEFPRIFRIYAKLRGQDRDIKAGTYVLQQGLGWRRLVDALHGGEGLERRITIPEGWSLVEIVPQLARALGYPEDSVRAAVEDTAMLHQLDIPTKTLEGYLFPDTYIFSYGTSPRVAVREMVRRFGEIWQSAWDERLQQLAMSRHDIITLASIVEKEARLPEERPVIAAVYLNRLRAQMPLQADPTVQYALGVHHERVSYKDLEVDSPYNTYRHPGLPPGPIASPGRASIEAALYPASVPYLYFVAHPDGHHEFRTTFKGHQEARAEVRRAQMNERK
jgi:UPF0755 protein